MSKEAVKSAKNGNAPQSSGDEPQSPVMAPPPDGGWGWMVVLASFFVHIIADGITYSFGVFYAEFLTYFGEGKAKTAWIVSLLVGVTLMSGPISSMFVNRYGCRPVTIAGAILASISVIVSAFAENVSPLIFTVGIGAGFGFGLMYLPAIVSVTVWFEKKRSLATGMAVCGAGLGTFVFGPLTKIIVDTYGWRGALLILGGLILNCIPCGMIFLPVPDPRRRLSVVDVMVPDSNKAPLIRSQSTEQVVRTNGSTTGPKESDVARLTLSQPALNKSLDSSTSLRRNSRQGSRVMERPDVLYQGSVVSLQNLSTRTEPSTAAKRLNQDKRDNGEDRCPWLPCSADFKSALAKMLDFSLLTDLIFVLFTVSNFLTSIGFYVPFVYIVALSEEWKIKNSEYLISVIGIANLVGRIVLGYISDKPYANRLMIYNSCLTAAGISTILAMSCNGFWGLAIYAIVFGFSIGAYVGLTSVVLVDLLGLDKLTNAFGLLLLFQGIASLLGPPFAGWFYDKWHTYLPGFYVAGAAIAMSGLMLFAIPCVEKILDRRRYQETAIEEM